MVPNPWWIGVGGGMNLWVGFEEETKAFAGWQLGVEAGRKMTPVLDLSLRVSAYSVNGHSCNPQHPLIDFSTVKTMEGTPYPYLTFNAFGLSALATATVDWTNLGGELPGGWHFYTPLSMGAAMLMGNHKNPDDFEHELDEYRMKGSFAMSVAMGLSYGWKGMELFGEAGTMLTSSSLDWSPEDASGIDLMPTLSLGVRFALPSRKMAPRTTYHYLSRSGAADREPRGLIDDMLLTNEEIHLPVAVVRFGREDSRLDDNAFRHLALFVSQIESSDWFTEFYIIGSADDARASQSHNSSLSMSRCKAVCQALVDDFNVDKYRLVILPDGGFSEYAHQYGDQMVLIIQRTPETEEVVERWIPTY